MSNTTELLRALCAAINAVKRTALSADAMDPDHYLGGDLGIDSIEMLEIWFRVEKAAGLRIPDEAKRDIYTVGEVVQVLQRHASAPEAAGADHV